MSEPNKSLRTIFAEAVEIADTQKRNSYLTEVCGTNLELRREVEELIQANALIGQFLPEQPAADRVGVDLIGAAAVLGVGGGMVPRFPLSEKIGSRIGRYKLLQQIGEGGMGVVFMAEQDEPVRRRVALKVVKLGMDTRSVIARFEAERQALALMDHPNIAKVLDAGATETGRPFFVMELVRGIKITDYCDQSHLSTQQRLGLFTQICQAIQHAHQKGIIHRDIKPSNILVTRHDGVAVPKIIDFGIAKATSDQRLTDKTLFTAFEQFIGTPAYMSPEQAEMSGLDIDTRSDIYSLGVLLYELLTGQTPFEAKELLAAGLDAMRRTIREQEPPKPSTRLSTMGIADTEDVTNRFRMSPTKLAALVRGDLNWIVMKALEKDRARRYETANGLAMDIQRHLGNEPVVARPPSAVYRFQKLCRRNKLTVVAISAVAVALVFGLGISTWMFMKERTDRRNAFEAEQRAETVSQFLKDMLKAVGPSVALGRDTKMLREILDMTATRVNRDLTNQPRAEAELLSTIGNTYYELGEWQKAETVHRDALRLRRAIFGETNQFVAASLNDLGNILILRIKYAEADVCLREALTIQWELFGKEHPDVAKTLYNLARVVANQGNDPEAETLLREALAMQQRLGRSESPETARTLAYLNLVLLKQNKLAEAEIFGRNAVALTKNLFGKEHPEVASALGRLSAALGAQEAESMQREALAMRRSMLGDDHPDVCASFDLLRDLLVRRSKLADAEELCRDVLAGRERLSPNGSKEVAAALGSLAYILFKENKFEEAEARQRRFLEMLPGLSIGAPREQNARDIAAMATILSRFNPLREFGRENCAAYGIPARDADTDANLIDLSAFYNAGFNLVWHEHNLGNDLSELPAGIQRFAGTRFDVRGLVQVASQQNGKERFPFEVTKLVIGRKCRMLHFLHGIIWGTEDKPGTIVGKYVMHYSSGADEERAIVLGKDALDWWTKPPEPGAVPSLTVAWIGHNPWSRSRGETIQLYKTTWENPRPDSEILSIDFVSSRKSAAPFLVAITVE